MNITIQSIHFDASSDLKNFIEKKVTKLEKIANQLFDAEVTLKLVKPESPQNKEASIKIKDGEFFASKIADTFEEAVVLSIEALEKQLLKDKEKNAL